MLAETGVAMSLGPTPAAETVAWCDEYRWLESARPGVTLFRARALAFLGRGDEALAAIDSAEATIRELGKRLG